jgi:hypothetical protein
MQHANFQRMLILVGAGHWQLKPVTPNFNLFEKLILFDALGSKIFIPVPT